MAKIIDNVESLRVEIAKCKSIGKTIGLVPTMGALHDGHLSLVRLAHEYADIVVVSIFVNPTQFGENEDLDSYPRDAEGDIAKLAAAAVDIIYMPNVAEIYPNGEVIDVEADAKLANKLCGLERPSHFDGVTTIVAKLFAQTAADIAVFGQKDYQQLQVIKRMVDDLNIQIRIIGAPIMRESDGLAMSSRNAYLTGHERSVAPQLNKIMRNIAQHPELIESAKEDILAAGFDSVDYVALVDAETLEPVTKINKPARLLAAVRIGNTRLIDNIAVEVTK